MYTYNILDLQQMTKMLLTDMINEYTLSTYPGGGAISSDPYNTAWVAMVHDPTDREQLAFPRALIWLLHNQSSDGSWGGKAPYSLLSTLAALLALLQAPAQYQQLTHTAISRARTYLEMHLRCWSVKTHESVGFEILVPSLLAQLETFGVDLECVEKADLMRLYQEKLFLTPLESIYSGQSTLIHSLEAFGPLLDIPRLKRLQSAYGSYTYSPAVTAAILIYGKEWDNDAAQWLTHLSQWGTGKDQGAMPSAYPLDTFETAWVIHNLAQGNTNLLYNTPESQLLLKRSLNWLESSLTPQGASLSLHPAMPCDGDDTALVLAALYLFNQQSSLDPLYQFERDSYFACYDQERVRSTSVNAHVLEALLSVPAKVRAGREEWIDKNIEKIVDFLYNERKTQGYWEDKWHVSSFYATTSCILALSKHTSQAIRSELEPTMAWIVENQSRIDGGWGTHGQTETGTTMEETAYAIQGLQAMLRFINDEDQCIQRAIDRGVTYLWNNLLSSQTTGDTQFSQTYPYTQHEPLWRDKTLYVPTRIVTSTILSVLSHSSAHLIPWRILFSQQDPTETAR